VGGGCWIFGNNCYRGPHYFRFPEYIVLVIVVVGQEHWYTITQSACSLGQVQTAAAVQQQLGLGYSERVSLRRSVAAGLSLIFAVVVNKSVTITSENMLLLDSINKEWEKAECNPPSIDWWYD